MIYHAKWNQVVVSMVVPLQKTNRELLILRQDPNIRTKYAQNTQINISINYQIKTSVTEILDIGMAAPGQISSNLIGAKKLQVS